MTRQSKDTQLCLYVLQPGHVDVPAPKAEDKKLVWVLKESEPKTSRFKLLIFPKTTRKYQEEHSKKEHLLYRPTSTV